MKIIKRTVLTMVLIFLLFVSFVAGKVAPIGVNAQTPPSGTYVKCVADELTKYFQAIVLGTRGLDKIKILAPAFNMTYPTEFDIFMQMKSGPRNEFFKPQNYPNFYGFAGNIYNIGDIKAYDWYASPDITGLNWKGDTVGAFAGTKMVFTEFGDAAVNAEHVGELATEFGRAQADDTVAAISLFDAMVSYRNPDPRFERHMLSNEQIASIVGSNPGKAGENPGTLIAGTGLPDAVKNAGIPNGWVVEIVTSPGNLGSATDFVNRAHENGYNPVLRTCVGDSCGFAEPQIYVNFLKSLNANINGPVWVIAGPNEPATGGDTWAAPACINTKPFELKEIPCNATQDPEFHSLRPYPASPCRKQVEPSYFICGQDLVVKDVYEFTPAGGQCSQLNATTKRCYFTVNNVSKVSLGLNDATFPIMGNTENVPNSTNTGTKKFFEYKTRVNEYVSWYLNGIPYRAEEIPATVDDVLSYAGPLKKLFPKRVQTEERINERARIGSERHNQIVYCGDKDRLNPDSACYRPLFDNYKRISDYLPNQDNQDSFNYLPFTSTEDRVGEASSYLKFAAPPCPAGNDDPSFSGVTCVDYSADNSSRKLYFAHIEEVNELAVMLQNTYKTKSVDDAGTAPPDPLQELIKTPYCELAESRSNPGDKLYGELVRPNDAVTEPISGTLTYSAKLQCDFTDPSTAEVDACKASCPKTPQADADQCNLECGTSKQTCQREIYIPFGVEIKTPELKTTWERLVAGSMSVVKRIFPKVGVGTPIEELKDIPGDSGATYRSQSSGGDPALLTSEALAGNPAAQRPGVTAKIFFPHLGSVYDYFLKDIQKALRPRGLEIVVKSEEAICSITGSHLRSQALLNIVANAARWSHVPVQVLLAVVEKEGCGYIGSTQGLCGLDDVTVIQYSQPGVQYPRNCSSGNGASGPMQIRNGIFGYWGNAVNLATGEGRTPDNCNIKDSIYAAAWILSANYPLAQCPATGYDVSGTPLPSAWTNVDMQRSLTKWVNGCMDVGQAVCTDKPSLPPHNGSYAGTYCNILRDNMTNIQTDCNL